MRCLSIDTHNYQNFGFRHQLNLRCWLLIDMSDERQGISREKLTFICSCMSTCSELCAMLCCTSELRLIFLKKVTETIDVVSYL